MPTILACVDLTESNETMLACARTLAGPDGEVVLLHVALEEAEFLPAHGSQSATAKELRKEHKDTQELAAELRAEGVNVRALTVQGTIVERILEHAERLPADYIVLAARAHWAIHDLVVASVLKGVLRGTKVPVVVAPQPPRS